ncbi:MAG: hypothetical protein ACOCQ2_02655 [Halanaerobiales bacterium]
MDLTEIFSINKNIRIIKVEDIDISPCGVTNILLRVEVLKRKYKKS